MTIDLQALFRSLSDPNRLVVVIKAHLWLERSINSCLEIRLDRPEALNIERMGFQQKANLVAALGMIDEQRADVIQRINTVRNHAAHRLDWELSDDETQSLIEQIAPSEFRDSDQSLNELLVLALTQLVGYVEGKAVAERYLLDNRDAIAARHHLTRHFQASGETFEAAKAQAVAFTPLPPMPTWEAIKAA